MFWFALVLLVLAGIALAVGLIAKRYEGRDLPFWGRFGPPIALFALGLLIMTIASITTVPVRSVGIVTSFNKPTGQTTGSGLHFIAPWKKVVDWDASIQTSDHTGDRPITVRIGSLATAQIENKVRWQVKPEAAPKQFNDYRGSFENMQKNLFETELQNALNEAFSDYNPLSSIDLSEGQTKFDGTALAEEVQKILQDKVGDQILIHSVVIPLVKHDQKTEENIKAFQDVIAQKRILEQRKLNAITEQQAADALKNLPATYTLNKCLDLAKDLGKEPGLCMGGASTIWNANK